jgi:rubrerythrin
MLSNNGFSMSFSPDDHFVDPPAPGQVRAFAASLRELVQALKQESEQDEKLAFFQDLLDEFEEALLEADEDMEPAPLRADVEAAAAIKAQVEAAIRQAIADPHSTGGTEEAPSGRRTLWDLLTCQACGFDWPANAFVCPVCGHGRAGFSACPRRKDR